MSVYVDTSAFAAIAFKDDGWQVLRDWIGRTTIALAFSDFGWGEFVSATGLRVRTRSLDAAAAARRLADTSRLLAGWVHASTLPADLARAADIISDFSLALRFPDAIHLAIAQRLDAALLTTDHIQARAAHRLGLAVVDPAHI